MSERVMLLVLVLLASGALARGEGAPPSAGPVRSAERPRGDAQDVELEVRVLVVRGNVVEIDRGSKAGVAPGDPVVLRPLGQSEVQGTVRDITADAATVVLSGASPALAPGVPGVVRMPAGRFPAADGRVPEGMPPVVWSNPDDAWVDDVPLLAEVQGPRPHERPTTWGGRGTLGGYVLSDSGALPRTDDVARVGLDLEGQNPFGRGGRAEVGLEVRSERTDFDDPALEDDSQSFLRIDRLSYAWGGTRGEPRRFEGGRFLSRAFPELGFLDGVEGSYRFADGRRVGGSVGFQPALDAERSFEDSPSLALWGLMPFGAEDRGELGVALQKTWFDGSADRDLAITRLRWTDGESWRASASAWFDLYTSDDVGKSSGVELSEARVNLTRDLGARSGLRVDAARVRLASVRRFRSQELTEERLFDADNDTLSLSAWLPAGERGSLTGRVGVWMDEEDDGGWLDLGYDHRVDGDALERWSLGVFLTDDPRNNVVGVRGRLTGPALHGRWSLGLDVGQYDRFDGAATEDVLQGALRGGWSGPVGDDWFLYLDGGTRFGDDQDAVSLDFTLQRSF